MSPSNNTIRIWPVGRLTKALLVQSGVVRSGQLSLKAGETGWIYAVRHGLPVTFGTTGGFGPRWFLLSRGEA